MKRVLVLLAHQDDEYFAAPWILEELRSGNDVACLYFTDGGSRTAPATRDAESRRVLQELGVKPDRIVFLGGADRISDGVLVKHITRAKELAASWLAENGYSVDRIYAPDYEGGHADHDAVYIVAAHIARAYRIAEDSWSFALYNACGCPRPAFRALKLLKRPGSRSLRYSLARGWSFAMLCWRYPSQRRTWLGLFPESLLRRVFVRTESLNRMDAQRTLERPHQGELLYERMFGVSYEDFAKAAEPLLADLRP
jgi:LmbE family N-acetylglucosaminyl deacetylase